MNENRSKLPDFKELGAMATKFLTDIKKSVEEIVQDYKKNRTTSEDLPVEEPTPPTTKPKVKIKPEVTKNPNDNSDIQP